MLDRSDHAPRRPDAARRQQAGSAQRRRRAGIVACLAVAVLGLGLLVRATSSGSPSPATVAVAGTAASPPAPGPGVSAPAAGGAVAVGLAGSSAGASGAASSQVTGPAPAVTDRAISGAPASARPAFAALSGASVTGGSPLRDVRQDQGMSVPLPDGRSLWIFADTTQTVSPFFFVTSSAAVSARGSKQLSYAATGTHLPVEFLPRTASEKAGQVNGSRYTAVWPTGATMLPDGQVLISYAKYQVTVSPPAYTLLGAGLYTFRYHGLSSFTRGAQATRIAGDLWTAAEGAVGSPVYSGGHVYFTQCEQLECYSARTTPAGMTSHSSYRWWTGSGWSASRTARVPMHYGASKPGLNPSVTYLPDYGVYATVSTAAGHLSGTGLLWVAAHPWGPWSAPASFGLPNCPSTGCYTLNVHPSESIGGRIRISYATSGIGPYVKVTDIGVRIGAGARSVSAG